LVAQRGLPDEDEERIAAFLAANPEFSIVPPSDMIASAGLAALGIAVAPQHGDDVTGLLRHADMAMYQAKNTHRGITVFDPADRTPETPAQLALVGELREGIGRGELRLYVQPKADAVSGDVVGSTPNS